MSVINFKVRGNKLIRTDMNRLVTYERNTAKMKFDFDSEWSKVSPIVAQFQRNDEVCYDAFVENGECIVPWEVLQEQGILNVGVAGGDVMLTNTVKINVISSGFVGGLAATEASPGLYKFFVDKTESINKDEVNTKAVKANTIECAEGITTDTLKLNSIDLSSTTEFDADAKKYASIKHKLKTGSGGFELSAVTTDKNGNELKNSIKTSNSKLTVDVNDYELKSAKNIELGCEGKLNVNSGNGIEILNEGHTVLTGNNSGYTTTIYGGDGATKMELDKENIEVDCEGDLTVKTTNERHFVGDSDGTFEVINSCNTGLIRMIQHNDAEKKMTKVYLGSDNVLMGVVSGVETGHGAADGSYITNGIKVSANSTGFVGDDVNICGANLTKLMPILIQLYETDQDKFGFLWDIAGGLDVAYSLSDEEVSPAVGYLSGNGYMYCAGVGATHDWAKCPFSGKTIKGLYVMEGITALGSYFLDSTELERIKLSDTLKSIGKRCFSNCQSLKGIKIPSSVTSIGTDAFKNCTNLTLITIDKTADSISGAPWGATNATLVWNG